MTASERATSTAASGWRRFAAELDTWGIPSVVWIRDRWRPAVLPAAGGRRPTELIFPRG
jgi:hypothetical protein